jgi:hypothetical protein
MDTVDTIAAFCQRVPAEFFSQIIAGINHFEDYLALHRV